MRGSILLAGVWRFIEICEGVVVIAQVLLD